MAKKGLSIDFNIIPLNSSVEFKKRDSGNQLSFLDITDIKETNDIFIQCKEYPKLSKKIKSKSITNTLINIKK